MIINHNLASMNTYRQLSTNSASTSKSLEKLSSGLRINRAGDDAAGLAISEKMRGQIRGLDQAARNGQDGISLIQTAEGALNETHSILQRMRELAVQSATDTNTVSDRSEMQKEVSQLTSEIDRIASTTEFNTKKLLNGSAGVAVSASTNSIQNAKGSADTVAGTYTTTSETLATAKNATSTVTFATTTTALTAASTLVVNGTSFNFTTSDTVQDVLDVVNAKSSTTGMTASFTAAAGITLTSNTAGSAAAFTVSGTGSFAAFGATAGGADAVVAGITGSYTAQGNHVTFTSGSAKGLEFDVNGTAATTITVNTNNALKMHIGANAGQNMSVSINDMSASALGIAAIDITTQSGADNAITTISNAITSVSAERSKLGAYQNRLEHSINNLNTSSENLTASESRIRDVDMAKEMMNFQKNNILQQAAQAMLAQANQQPQGVLQLLR